MEREDVETIKVKLPRSLAERFRRYAAEKYGLRRGALSKAVEELIKKELGGVSPSKDDISAIVGLGLSSDYSWDGEDLVEALRRRSDVLTGR